MKIILFALAISVLIGSHQSKQCVDYCKKKFTNHALCFSDGNIYPDVCNQSCLAPEETF